MSGEVERVLAEVLENEGGGPGSSIHSWRREHPDRYGPCSCVAGVAEAQAAALVPVIDAEVERRVGVALSKVADDWQWKGWSDVLIPDATKNPIANGQRVTEWLRETAGGTR